MQCRHPVQQFFGKLPLSGVSSRKETENQIVFHAGTKLDSEGKPVTSGGRVLCVVGLADTMRMAQKTAYEAVEAIHFDGVQYRSDIGWRALKRAHDFFIMS